MKRAGPRSTGLVRRICPARAFIASGDVSPQRPLSRRSTSTENPVSRSSGDCVEWRDDRTHVMRGRALFPALSTVRSYAREGLDVEGIADIIDDQHRTGDLPGVGHRLLGHGNGRRRRRHPRRTGQRPQIGFEISAGFSVERRDHRREAGSRERGLPAARTKVSGTYGMNLAAPRLSDCASAFIRNRQFTALIVSVGSSTN